MPMPVPVPFTKSTSSVPSNTIESLIHSIDDMNDKFETMSQVDDDINEDEYKLAIIKTNFELIQKYCKNNIIQVVNNLSNIDDLELDEIINKYPTSTTDTSLSIKLTKV